MSKISDERVKEIFEKQYVPYLQKLGGNASLMFVGPVATGPCMSQIYCIKNPETGTEYILKVVTNVNEHDRSKHVTVAYNEIMSLCHYYCKTNFVPQLVDAFEYRDGHSFVFFIVMEKCNTLGDIELKTEKEVFDAVVNILEILSEMHKESDFDGAYTHLVQETNLSFPVDFLLRNYTLNYRSKRLVIHRDIKPANILVRINDRGERVFLLADFGTVTFVNPCAEDVSDNVACNRFFTEDYADPQFVEKVKKSKPLEPEDVNSDIFSLGLTIKHLLTAASVATRYDARYKEKFAGEIAKSEMLKDLTKPDHISPEFWNIIDRMTLRTGSRYKNVDEVLEELQLCYVNGYISDCPFPVEFVKRNRLIQLVSERRFSELRQCAEDQFKIDPHNTTYLMIYVYAHIRSFSEEKRTEFECLLNETNDPMARCLAAMIRVKYKKSNEQSVFKELADQGCIPAAYCYVREAKKYPKDSDDWRDEITQYYEMLFESYFVPGCISYLNVLEDREKSAYIQLSTEEKKYRIERIKEYLTESNIDITDDTNVKVAFFEHMF